MPQFNGQVLIVTGGARVLLADVDATLGHALTAEIGRTAVFHQTDVRDPAAYQGAIARVVGGILFLLSDEARYVTATNLVMDGGVTKSIFNHFPGRTWD